MIKNIRRIIQLTFFALFIAAFIPSVSESLKPATEYIIDIQFFPSLIRTPLIPAAVIVFTLIFGRFYCSSVCPLASVQDLFSCRIKKYRYRKLKLFLRYAVPFLSLLLLLAGFTSIASLTDPYSLAGRFLHLINRVIAAPLIKAAAYILRRFSVYIPESEIQLTLLPLAAVLPFLILLILMSGKRGRLYCNTLCPVGALLSLVSGFSLFAVRIKKENCTSCGACEKVCKAEAADSASRTVDASKCISCFNCLSVCSFDALEYGRNKKIIEVTRKIFRKLRKLKTDRLNKNTASGNIDDPGESCSKMNIDKNSGGRRDFLIKSGAVSALLFSSLLIRRAKPDFLKLSDKGKAVPPGSVSRINLLSKCTGCSLCINNCPTGVLFPDLVSHLGFSGFGAPYLDYNKGYCDYKCKRCSDICPSGAIKKLDSESRKTVKIGEAEFVREFCIVETDRTSCGACAEVCPTGAIDLIHIGSSESGPLEIPLISSRFCIGCGACQYACPVTDKNAIYVLPFNTHKKADPPAEKEDTAGEDIDTGFAF